MARVKRSVKPKRSAAKYWPGLGYLGQRSRFTAGQEQATIRWLRYRDSRTEGDSASCGSSDQRRRPAEGYLHRFMRRSEDSG